VVCLNANVKSWQGPEDVAIEGLYVGPDSKEHTKAIFIDLLALLRSIPNKEPPRLAGITGGLKPSNRLIYSPPDANQHGHSHVLLYLDICRPNNVHLRTLSTLLVCMFKARFHFYMRTVEKLGYDSRLEKRMTPTQLGIVFSVQSKHDPVYLHKRIEAFITEFVSDHLEKMTEEEFKNYTQVEFTPSISVKQEAMQYFDEILDQSYDFGAAADNVKHINSLSKRDMEDFIRVHILLGGEHHASLEIHQWGRDAQQPSAGAYDNVGAKMIHLSR